MDGPPDGVASITNGGKMKSNLRRTICIVIALVCVSAMLMTMLMGASCNNDDNEDRDQAGGPQGTDPRHHHLHPGHRPAGRVDTHVRGGQRLQHQGGRGGQRRRHGDGPQGRGRRAAGAQPGGRGEAGGRRVRHRARGGHAQRLHHRGPALRPRRHQGHDQRGRGHRRRSPRPAPPSSRGATTPAPTARRRPSGRPPASRPPATGTSRAARAWGTP